MEQPTNTEIANLEQRQLNGELAHLVGLAGVGIELPEDMFLATKLIGTGNDDVWVFSKDEAFIKRMAYKELFYVTKAVRIIDDEDTEELKKKAAAFDRIVNSQEGLY